MTDKKQKDLLILNEYGLRFLLIDFLDHFGNVYKIIGEDASQYFAEDVASFLWVKTGGYLGKYRGYSGKGIFKIDNQLECRHFPDINNEDYRIINESHKINKKLIFEAIKQDKAKKLITGKSDYEWQ